MKLGMIFKKKFHDKYGHKQEFYGDIIIIERGWNDIIIKTIKTHTPKEASFPVEVIQLIYLGEWNL